MMTLEPTPRSAFRSAAAMLGGLVLVTVMAVAAAPPKFYADDPLAREPETADASKAQPISAMI